MINHLSACFDDEGRIALCYCPFPLAASHRQQLLLHCFCCAWLLLHSAACLACCMPCCICPLLVVHIGQLQHLHCLCVLQHKKLSYFLLHTTRARCYTTAGAGERAEHKPDTLVKSIYRHPRSELGRVRRLTRLESAPDSGRVSA